MKKKGLKIAILTKNPINAHGGIERFIHNLMKLGNGEIDFHIFDGGAHSPSNRFLKVMTKKAGVDSIYLATHLGNIYKSENKYKNFDILICNQHYGWNVNCENAINVYHYTSPGLAIAIKDKISRSSYIQTKTTYGLFEKLNGLGKKIITVSKAVKDEVRRYYNLPVYQVIVNGIDLDLFNPSIDQSKARKIFHLPQDKILILYIGRYDRGKGIELVQHLSNKINGKMMRIVSACDKELNGRNIINIGWINYQLLPQLYGAVDFVIFPSYYEGAPNVLIEAFACGKPIIISNVGMAKNFSDESRIFEQLILKTHEPNDWLHQINILASDGRYRKSISEKCREYALRYFDLKTFRNSYTDVINEIMT